MGLEKPVCSFRLRLELVESLKVLAAQENRNLSNFVETILLNYVKEHEDHEE